MTSTLTLLFHPARRDDHFPLLAEWLGQQLTA
jgi:hypothetical protein